MTFLILSLFISNGRPAQQIVMFTFPQAVLKVFLLQNDSAVTQFVTPHRPLLHLKSDRQLLPPQFSAGAPSPPRPGNTLYYKKIKELLHFASVSLSLPNGSCLFKGWARRASGQSTYSSPRGRLQLSPVLYSSFSQWDLLVGK